MLASDMGVVRHRWNVLVVGLLAGAVAQHWIVGARIAHAATICWKTGVEAGLITVHGVPQIMFVVFSGIGVALSVLAAQRLLLKRSLGGYMALLSTAAYIAGVTVWGALLATPFVQIVY
ncbi:hypothetical protein WMF31_37010 [Sorangium sp. So ce1036]|uniref:hypothetical protein n=1 Tax=Sorangium sp. So ce1036 TaxID=3133328 RepID=UPI003F0465BB